MRIPRWVLGAGVAAALIGSGVIAAGIVSAAPSTTTAGSTTSTSTAQKPSSTFLGDLASHLGISLPTLQSALKQTEIDQVQHLQQAGKITSTRAQTLEQRIQAGTGLPLPFGPRPSPGRGVRPGPINVLQTAAQYLGLTGTQLRTDLRGGQSLDGMANAQSGKSAAGLKTALSTAAQTALQKQVTAGTITATQEQTRLTAFENRLTNLLSRKGLAAAAQGAGRPCTRGAWRTARAGANGSASAATGGTGSSTSGSGTGGSNSGA